jgi:hypothetical protein
MKIIKVTYQNKYITGPYLNHQPGFEAEIDGTVEDPIECLLKLRAIADAFDKKVNNFEERLVSADQPEVATIEDKQIDLEFEAVKKVITDTEYQEDALFFLENNPVAKTFRLNIELKILINSKPKKNV